MSGITGISLGNFLPKSNESEEITSKNIDPPSVNNLVSKLDKNNAIKQTRLAMNTKMVAGIAMGVLIGVVMIGIIASSVAASYGIALPVIGLLLAKLQTLALMGSGLVANIPYIAAAAPFVATILPNLLTLLGFLAIGRVAGTLVKKGEAQSMDLIAKRMEGCESLYRKGALLDKCTISENEIEAQIAIEQAHISSSQAARNLDEESLRLGLHYPTLSSILKNPLKIFGHFWSKMPYNALKSLFDRVQYAEYNKNIDIEEALKVKSAENDLDSAAIIQLNRMRQKEIDQLIKWSQEGYQAYKKYPQGIIYDRELIKLEILGQREKSLDKKEIILTTLDELKELKARKLDPQMLLRNDQIVKSLFSITADINKLNLSLELKGQIYEAVTLLLTTYPQATLQMINGLVQEIYKNFEPLNLKDIHSHWHYRQSSLLYAQKFSNAMQKGEQTPEFELQETQIKAPMTKQKSFYFMLKFFDAIMSIAPSALAIPLAKIANKFKPRLKILESDQRVQMVATKQLTPKF